METSLDHADERDLIETFVERSRWHCRAAGDFQLGRISTRDDGAREYNLSVTARMLLIGESRFGVQQKLPSVGKFHSITSSARASSVGGISRPSARAVGKLITNSNLVDCITGKSSTLAPLRRRPA